MYAQPAIRGLVKNSEELVVGRIRGSGVEDRGERCRETFHRVIGSLWWVLVGVELLGVNCVVG